MPAPATHSYTGAAVPLRRVSGAIVTRVMHPPGQHIEAHAHDWPVLALYCVGAYRENGEDGKSVLIDAPGAVLNPAGSLHANEIGAAGLETVSMCFDPVWLTPEARAVLPAQSHWRTGAHVAFSARALSRAWLSPDRSEADLRAMTSSFVLRMARQGDAAATRPTWLDQVLAAIEAEDARTHALATELSRHPAWLTRAFRAWRGEGVAETVRRRRTERAMLMLRSSAASLAEIAAAAGFCDQSHMNRCFKSVLGRTPLQVRREADLLAAFAS